MGLKTENFIIINLDKIDSTHKYIKEYILKNGYKNPICVVTQNQTNGVGSRDNQWIGTKGNLFFSFAIDKTLLPLDLPLQSSSIYFSFLLIEVLRKYSSKVWLKWPNDFYIDNDKIGGTITNYNNNILYCGIGLNLIESNDFKSLDISFNIDKYLKDFIKLLNSKLSWKKIFSKYLIEFEKSKQFTTTVNNQKISLHFAKLQDDGSIDIDNKKVFSLR